MTRPLVIRSRSLRTGLRIAGTLIAAAVAVLASPIAARQQSAARQGSSTRPPKLVVLVVVDQMRADYVARFRNDWTGGLKRLVTNGAWFTNAAYPYLQTMTCAGHATVSTGVFPHTHGIVSNEWWDRETGQEITCTQDSSASAIGYLAEARGGDSARRLAVPTFADRMRAERSAHVVSLSMKDRSAVMLAGHGEGTVAWFNVAMDNMVTSSAFTSAPVPQIRSFLSAHPLDGDFGKAWSRLLPPSRYHEPDDVQGEIPPRGWTRTFPHTFNGANGKPDAAFRGQWDHSPFVDAYIGGLAESLVASTQLGRHDGTDLLALGFSSTDRVGHQFGPNSQEVHDTQIRLDRTLGSLFNRLDALVGRSAYVVALTADHGVTPFSDDLLKSPSRGQVELRPLVERIEQSLQAPLGPGKYVQALNGSNMNLYFAPDVYDRLVARPEVLGAMLQLIRETPGIRRVIRREEAIGGVTSSDPLIKAAALSYFPGRSGDLVLVLEPSWTPIVTISALHWSGSPDDQRVPILFMGPGIKPGSYGEAVTPADIAPTLAALTGVSLPNTEGRVLRSALSQSAPSTK